jgi:hypothetical protein
MNYASATLQHAALQTTTLDANVLFGAAPRAINAKQNKWEEKATIWAGWWRNEDFFEIIVFYKFI